MRALVTGSKGFIGTHLCAELSAHGCDVVLCDLANDEGIVTMDILDAEAVTNVLKTYQPDVLFNLAGQANVGLSWKRPQLTVELNTVGFINILEAVKTVEPATKVIAVGSSDEYGNLGQLGTDVSEDIPLRPMTPYAISKQAQEFFADLYVRTYGLDVRMVRLFNLGGPGQAKGFLISDFTSGIVEIEMGRREFLSVGNRESARDFTHVRDACRALRLIAERGHTGEVYNVCSGVTHTVQEVLDSLISLARTCIDVRSDPERMRPSDTPVVRGNHDKLTAHTGWEPELGFERMLEDALDYWRNHQ